AGPELLHLRGHVAVDIVSETAPAPVQRVLKVFACLVIAVFAAVFAAVSWPLAVNAWSLGETSFSAWNPPIWWLKFVVPFAFVMLCAQALVEAVFALRNDARTEARP
ncbi:MAG: TRAP transporter small permease subunit, partial [Paracoccus sp. (in: a-proteobacteria)]